MIRHPRRTLPAAVVALVVLAVCVLVVVACVQSLLGRTPFLSLDQLLAATGSQSWSSAALVAVAVVVALVGLVLLVAAIRPGRPTVMPLATWPDSSTVAGVRRASLAKDLAAAAGAVPGVSGAEVAAGRARVVVTVQVAAADPAAVPDAVRARIESRLAAIGPAPSPRVRVRARRDRRT